MKQLLFLISFLVFSARLSAQQTTVDSSATSYLFIGNSFTYMNDMPKLFESMAKHAGKRVYVQSNTKGGASFEEHANRESVYESIASHPWDYVILQGFSREFIHAAQYVDSATVPHLNKLLDAIYANNPCTNVHFYMTWGYENGFGGYQYTSDFLGMADTIHGGYLRIGKRYGLPVVPAGAVWKKVREKSRVNLYTRDHYHPNQKGSFLVASTFFSSFYNEPNEYYAPFGLFKRKGKMISRTAFDYVQEHRSRYTLDNHEAYINWEGKGDTVDAQFSASFPNAQSYTWIFNGMDTLRVSEGNYPLPTDRSHKVELVVGGDCGERHYVYPLYYRQGKNARRNRKYTGQLAD
jgi:hypothetical protein